MSVASFSHCLHTHFRKTERRGRGTVREAASNLNLLYTSQTTRQLTTLLFWIRRRVDSSVQANVSDKHTVCICSPDESTQRWNTKLKHHQPERRETDSWLTTMLSASSYNAPIHDAFSCVRATIIWRDSYLNRGEHTRSAYVTSNKRIHYANQRDCRCKECNREQQSTADGKYCLYNGQYMLP